MKGDQQKLQDEPEKVEGSVSVNIPGPRSIQGRRQPLPAFSAERGYPPTVPLVAMPNVGFVWSRLV
jgi:hypothetical protein